MKAPVQKFECEHCGKVSADVCYDETFEGALCDKCIKLVGEGSNGEQSEAVEIKTRTGAKGAQGDAEFIAKRNDKIIEMYVELGMSVRDIAEHFDLSNQRVRQILTRSNTF